MKPVLEHNAICSVSPLYLFIDTGEILNTCYQIRMKTLVREMAPALRELRFQNVFMLYWLEHMTKHHCLPNSQTQFIQQVFMKSSQLMCRPWAKCHKYSLIRSSQPSCQTLSSKILSSRPSLHSCISHYCHNNAAYNNKYLSLLTNLWVSWMVLLICTGL